MADANGSNKPKTAPALDEKASAESKKKEAEAKAAANKAKLDKEAEDRKVAEQEAKRRAAANATQNPVNNGSDTNDNPGDPGDTVPEDEDVTGERKNPINKTVSAPEGSNLPAPNVELQRGVPVVGSEEAETITATNKPNLQENGAPARAARPSRPERRSDLQVLIDALPDELYDAFVKPYNLNSRGVDEESGFDLRKVDNPTLDSIRINLRQQGYFV